MQHEDGDSHAPHASVRSVERPTTSEWKMKAGGGASLSFFRKGKRWGSYPRPRISATPSKQKTLAPEKRTTVLYGTKASGRRQGSRNLVAPAARLN